MKTLLLLLTILSIAKPFFQQEIIELMAVNQLDQDQIVFTAPPFTEIQQLTEQKLNAFALNQATGFPGQIFRYGDDHRDIVYKVVTKPTRRLHPAKDCYRALGFTISDEDLFRDELGQYWSVFRAVNLQSNQDYWVKEQIIDATGRRFSDMSTWIWQAYLGKSIGPWWVKTIVTQFDFAKTPDKSNSF